mmetsp:Transcript_12204/g.12229  ORF Transcript_12204/g.12229 Transcript_12204/m.12229 type:complete len:190 (-) Transcript_12204:187-756(-)
MFSPQAAYKLGGERDDIIKPKPIHIYNANTGDKSTKSIEAKEKEIKSEVTEIKESTPYVFIDSVHPGGDKIRVLKSHLERILKVRASRAKVTRGRSNSIIHRGKPEGPIHGSRSKFAKRRPRDQNGRFYTKAELEEMRRQNYIQAAADYLESHPISGQSVEIIKSQSYEEVLKSFPERVFNIVKVTKRE